MCKQQKHPFLHLRTSCLKMGWVTIPKAVSTFIQCQGSLCSKFKRIHQLQLQLSHGNHFVYRHNTIIPQNVCSRIIIRPAKQLITQKNHPPALLKVYVDHCKLSWECTHSTRFTIVLKHRVFTMDFCLCGAIFNLKAFCLLFQNFLRMYAWLSV